MKRLAPLFLAAGTLVGLAACTTYGPGPGPGPYAYGYVDGYYDNAYGPFYDGYWGPDDYFYYRSGPHGGFIRDDAHHFRHDGGGGGFHSFHAHQAPPAVRRSPRG